MARSLVQRHSSPVAGLYSCSFQPSPNPNTTRPAGCASNCSMATRSLSARIIERRVVAGSGERAGRKLEHPQEESGRNVRARRPRCRRSPPRTRGRHLPGSRLRPPTISVDRPGPAPNPALAAAASPARGRLPAATPAVSGVSAQPSPRYQSGGSSSCQSISFGRTPPISARNRSGQRYDAVGAPWWTSARSLRSGSATNQTGARPPLVPVLHELEPLVLGGAGRRAREGRRPIAHPSKRPPQVEVVAAVHRQDRRGGPAAPTAARMSSSIRNAGASTPA